MKITIKTIMLAFLSLLAASVHAADLFTPAAGDISMQMLGKLFGGLVGGGADPLKDVIGTFNAGVLAVGGILVAYTIFAGTIGTAHDGEMMGKKFSSVWIPLRTALGTALVLPIDGYCTMQMIVMWLVMQGIGLADTVWSSLVSGDALMTGTVQVSAYKSPEVIKLANTIAKASICLHAARTDSEINNRGETWTAYPMGNSIYFGRSGSLFQQTSCGQIQLLDESKPEVLKASGAFANLAEQVGTSKSTLPILQAHNNATRAMVSGLYGATSGYVVTLPTGNTFKPVSDINAFPSDVISNAVATYTKTVQDATTAYYTDADESGKAIKANADNEGWITAGAWFMKLSSQMSKASSALASTPSAEANKKITGLVYREVNEILAMSDSALAKDPINAKSGLARQNATDNAGEDSFGAIFYRWLGSLMTNINIEEVANTTNVHPIIQMKAMGDSLINGAITSIIVLITSWTTGVVALGGGSMMLGGGVTGATTTVSAVAISAAVFITPIAFMIFGSLITLGFFLSYYIPMMPFLIWLGCVIGWLIMVVEAVIAAPLWAVMHLHPNGDDAVGKGGAGYMLVLGLLLRPTLMIFGLASALILSMVVGQFINSMFYDVFKMSRGGDTVGLFGTILVYALYTTAMTVFMKKMFEVIHVIPDHILRWIGGGASQLGEYGGAMIAGTEGQFMKAGAAAGYVGQRGLEGGLATAQRRASLSEDTKNRASQAAGDIGMTIGQVASIAARGNGLEGKGNERSGFAAMNAMSRARNSIQAQGGGTADLARFNADVEDSEKPYIDAIADAMSNFKSSKAGNAGQHGEDHTEAINATSRNAPQAEAAATAQDAPSASPDAVDTPTPTPSNQAPQATRSEGRDTGTKSDADALDEEVGDEWNTPQAEPFKTRPGGDQGNNFGSTPRGDEQT